MQRNLRTQKIILLSPKLLPTSESFHAGFGKIKKSNCFYTTSVRIITEPQFFNPYFRFRVKIVIFRFRDLSSTRLSNIVRGSGWCACAVGFWRWAPRRDGARNLAHWAA